MEAVNCLTISYTLRRGGLGRGSVFDTIIKMAKEAEDHRCFQESKNSIWFLV